MRNFECKIFHSPQTHSQIIINKPGTRERWLEKGDVVMFDDRFVHKSIIIISWFRSNPSIYNITNEMMKVGGELAGVNDSEAEFLSITSVRATNSVQPLKSSQSRV